MAVPISNVTRRTVYAPSGTGGVGPYSFTFEILANTDIAVYKDDTLLTLTTHYTVTINANGTGSVLINATGLALAPVSPTQYAVVGNRTIQRTTDFTTGGDFFANTINDELDQQTIFAQQNAEGLARALSAPQTDPTSINMTLPAKATRANKTLTFDANGNPSAGVSAADVANAVTYATNAAASATASAASAAAAASSASAASGSASTASTQATNASASASSATSSASSAGSSASTAGTQASNASTSASNAAASASTATTQATNAATSASTATTQATNAASSATSANTAKVAAEAARDSALAAYDNFDDRYLGPYASNPTVDNDGNTLLAGALYFNTVAPEMRLWTGSAWVAAYVSGSGFLSTSNNLSELTATASTARTNIGLGTAATMTGPAGTIVGTTDSQTLTNKTLTGAVMNGTLGATTPSTGAFTTLSASGAGTLQDLITTTGALIRGTSIFRVESTAAALPAGTPTGLGLEMYASSGTQKLSVYNRTTNLAGPLDLLGSTFNFNAILDISNASAGQIKFPVTPNASANAKTLDDYEKGTYTPTFTSMTVNSGSAVYSGKYTKIGNLCYAMFGTTGTQNVTAVAGTTQFSLPFVSSGINFAAGLGSGPGLAQNGSTTATSGLQGPTNGASNGYFIQGLAATNSIVGSITYHTA